MCYLVISYDFSENKVLVVQLGMTPTGKNFTVEITFMCNEQAMTYRWVLQQIKHLYVTSAMANSHLALKTIWMEIKKARGMVEDPGSKCWYYLRKSYGLPCACELVHRCQYLIPIQLEDVYIFWKKLEIGSDIPDVHKKDMDSEMRDLTLMLEESNTGPISKVRKVRRLIKGVICPVLLEHPCPPLTNP
ncbi:hypothetical protein M9H77_24404 [Catharanthus roseus]|uniref:Uncharacterized protein n=1 Tax=Catharanthus roseus TaxID=4058 RepID=A0ACC0AWE3_CATRO|nr:hypothetical protein M9H77_24404 [Catharanthus roseus]